MTIRAVTTERRWLVERRDGRWMECRVVPVRHPDYGIVFETQAYFDGTVFYARQYPTRLEAEHDADDRLRDAVEYGWIKSESNVSGRSISRRRSAAAATVPA